MNEILGQKLDKEERSAKKTRRIILMLLAGISLLGIIKGTEAYTDCLDSHDEDECGATEVIKYFEKKLPGIRQDQKNKPAKPDKSQEHRKIRLDDFDEPKTAMV